jgi:hypothetical protein
MVLTPGPRGGSTTTAVRVTPSGFRFFSNLHSTGTPFTRKEGSSTKRRSALRGTGRVISSPSTQAGRRAGRGAKATVSFPSRVREPRRSLATTTFPPGAPAVTATERVRIPSPKPPPTSSQRAGRPSTSRVSSPSPSEAGGWG